MTEARRLRLFVALELPVEWRDALAAEARALESAVPGFGRWVDPALMHVTLVFLGYQDAGLLPTIERAVQEAAATSAPFALRLGEPGSFGGRRSLRVIWVGVVDRPADALVGLHQAVVSRLHSAGVSFDPAPFRAHITLGRARRGASAAQSEAMYNAFARRAADPRRRLPVEQLQCEELTLMRSDLRPPGPIYTPLQRTKLATRE